MTPQSVFYLEPEFGQLADMDRIFYCFCTYVKVVYIVSMLLIVLYITFEDYE